MSERPQAQGLFEPEILARAGGEAFAKLDPRALMKNPVIFVTEVASTFVTVLFARDLLTHSGMALFSDQIAAWLWFTVLFANFAEAVAGGRRKAHAKALRRTRSDAHANRYVDFNNLPDILQAVNALALKVGDIVLVKAGEIIAGDSEIVEGVVSLNEAAITRDSAPVIHEAGGDRSALTDDTTALPDRIKVRIAA